MGKRSLNRQREGSKASWRSRLALVLVLVLTLAGSAGIALPGTATIASAAETATAAQSNNQVTVSVIGMDAKGHSVYFLAPTSVSIAKSTNGWNAVEAAFDNAGLKYYASDTQYGKFLESITNPATGQALANEDYTKANAKSWILYVNGASAQTGISSVTLKPGDTVTWVYSSYNADYSAPGLPGKPMYRLYNPNSGEHFYTASTKERDTVIAAGWNNEGIGWYEPIDGDPVYRLYNPNAGEHHYTLSAAERDNLIKAGWRYEGIGWNSDPQKSVTIYREYNPNQYACNHNFTASKAEHDHLVGLGWRNEGIAWYGVTKTID